MNQITKKPQLKDKQRRFKLSEEEDNKLVKLAHERNYTISEYIRQCCLNKNTIPVIDRSSEILQHVACLSTLVSELKTETELHIRDNTLDLIQEEVLALWQFLN